MKRLIVIALSFFILASMFTFAGEAIASEGNKASQIITRAESGSWAKGPKENFSGKVIVKPVFLPNNSAHFLGASVNFKAGARSAWHIHPTGQYILVTDGIGWTQHWGGQIEEIRPGDVVWCPPGVKHWHGASPNSEMTHLVLMQVAKGESVKWLEKVSDEQYSISNLATSQSETTNNQALNSKQQSIVTIAAFTANGNLERLKISLNEGLDAGLTINEIKEVLVQIYAYAGFPRSLNGLGTFRTVLEEREERGIKDEVGATASPLPEDKSSLKLGREVQTNLVGRSFEYGFAPVMDKFLKAHLFGDIFGRDILSYKTRELVTVAALANMEGVNPQLLAHLNIAFNVGVTKAEMKSLISVIEAKVGKKEADNTREVFNRVLSLRGE